MDYIACAMGDRWPRMLAGVVAPVGGPFRLRFWGPRTSVRRVCGFWETIRNYRLMIIGIMQKSDAGVGIGTLVGDWDYFAQK